MVPQKFNLKGGAERILAIGLFVCPIAAHAGYVLQNIVNNGDVNFNQELAINDSGIIAGYFGDGMVVPNNGYTLAPPYGPSNFTAENFPSGNETQTQVTGINNSGTTVGFWVDSSGANHGFTDIGGSFTSIDNSASTASPIFTQFLGVNNSNEVAGFYLDAAGNAHAFTWQGGTFTPINPAGATMATATDVNNGGNVSGFLTGGNGDTYGFLDVGNSISTYLYPGSTFTQFLGLNNDGLVVGDYEDASGTIHGIVYDALTNTWQVVDDPFAGTGTGAGTTINGINDVGQIVGFYTNPAGQTIGLLGTETPEPDSLALIGIGLVAVGWCWKRGRRTLI